jgi:hypothetical protein
VDEIVAHKLDRPGKLNRMRAPQEFLEQNLDLKARDVIAEAGMNAGSKS